MLGMGGRPYREADPIQAEGRDHGAHSTQEHNPVQWLGSRVSYIGEHQDDQDSQRNRTRGICRMGRFYRVAGPGIILSIPLIDRIAVVDLDRAIPEWQEVSYDELNAMVEFLVTQYPEIPSNLSLEEIREAMYVKEPKDIF